MQLKARVVRVTTQPSHLRPSVKREVKLEFIGLPNDLYRDLILESETLQPGEEVVFVMEVRRSAQSVAC